MIARKHGFEESTLSSKYLSHLQSRERVGSSQRYGYLFEDNAQKMWIAEPHVQMYLDSIAGNLPPVEPQNIIATR
jgi:asparagine synthase (glutamine-hydrolysing)